MTEKYKCLQQSLFLVWKTFSLWDLFWRFIWLMNFHHVRRMLRSWIFKSSSFLGWFFSGNAIWISWILSVLRNNEIYCLYISRVFLGGNWEISSTYLSFSKILKGGAFPHLEKSSIFPVKLALNCLLQQVNH